MNKDRICEVIVSYCGQCPNYYYYNDEEWICKKTFEHLENREEFGKECPLKEVEGTNKECEFLEKNEHYDFCTSSYSSCDYCNYEINYANMTNKQKELIMGLILTSMVESSYYRDELIDLLDLIEEV